MERWITIVGVLLLAVALAACGGAGQDGDDTDATPAGEPTGTATASPTRTPAPTSTLRPPAPRSLPVPEGDPQQFETPFSAGAFLRESLRGNAVSPQTGGQRATYMHPDGGKVEITVYRFQSLGEAQRTVEFTLGGNSIDTLIGEPYYAPAVSFGLAQDRQGSYLAAWSRDRWVYIARAPDRALLDQFLAVYPY